MPGFLRQATASQARALGPFLSDSDFKTAQTGLTIANTDIKLVVNGGASANKNSGGGTHRVNGEYGVTFDATDTATVGELQVSVVVAGALPVFDKFFVVEEAVYDALFAAAAPGYGTAQTGDSFARLGAPVGASVSADVASVKTDTGTTLPGRLPAALVSGRMDASIGAMAANTLTATAIAADAITAAKLADGAIDAATFAAGAIDANALATDAIGSAEISAAAVTKIQAGLSTYAGGDTPGTTTLLTRLTATRAGYLDNLSAGAAALEASVQAVLTKLLKYVQLMLRKDAAIATDNATEVTAINADGGSGAGGFANTTDSQEALRDRGDAAWTTATGFAVPGSAMALTSGERDTLTDALVDQTLSGHTTAGTVGGALQSAGSAGDPWVTLLPGSYSAGQAGKLVGDNLNATVSSRSTLDAAGVRAAVGLASANLDTQLDALPTNAELATALAGADDATLAAIAALNDVSSAEAQSAVAAALTAYTSATSSQVSAVTSTLSALIAALNDVGAADIRGAVGLATGNLDTQLAAIASHLPEGITKNQAFTNFAFKMVLESDHLSAATGLTVTATRAIDGGTFADCTNSPTEMSNGFYKINLSAADLNGDFITLRFTAGTADTRTISFKTSP